jgi:hypothetical protein|tara:strand:+ start:1671 stop:1814 length:144 start_codon:yes stop_codon:yes gene_type:complete
MDTTEHWEAREAMIDQISAALSYAEDQLEDLRSLITDEIELVPALSA